MTSTPNYLIGGGERLSLELDRPRSGFGEKKHPYTFDEVVHRLAPHLQNIGNILSNLPDLACPNGNTVIGITLHPSYLAKSYYPQNLLRELDLQHIGSRTVRITPFKTVTKLTSEQEKLSPATLLYVAGNRKKIINFAKAIKNWSPTNDALRLEFREIEQINPPEPERKKWLPEVPEDKAIPLEIVLHNTTGPNLYQDEFDDIGYIERAFIKYIGSLGLEINQDYLYKSGGLSFLPLHASKALVPEILKFSYLRALRAMPKLTSFEPYSKKYVQGFSVNLPDKNAIADDLKVAIFDGGLPLNNNLEKWVTQKNLNGIGAPVQEATEHGLAVTSAFLFGPLANGKVQTVPYANVDHWRVIGGNLRNDDIELYKVLKGIEKVLLTNHYDFVNLSIGPECSIEDDDVNAWTSTLDNLLADGDTLALVACGNNGELDKKLGFHRIQPPSDGVNIIAVGAANSTDARWTRAAYSAYGPGRNPGYIKPDIVSFGGSEEAPFLVLDPHMHSTGVQGTSFASPLAMRSAVGIRSQFTDELWAPTIKALLIHQASANDNDSLEVGWGRVSHNISDLITCNDGEAHIIYQMKMPETGAVRLFLPVPNGLSGNLEIKATFCFFCDVDPEDTINYTRGGLEIQFRPHEEKFAFSGTNGTVTQDKKQKTQSFYQSKDYYSSEYSLRRDAHKWETVLSKTLVKRTDSLLNPVFDVTYINRIHGHQDSKRPKIKFSLVVTLKNKDIDLYNKVLLSSQNRLEPLKPRADLRFTTRNIGLDD